MIEVYCARRPREPRITLEARCVLCGLTASVDLSNRAMLCLYQQAMHMQLHRVSSCLTSRREDWRLLWNSTNSVQLAWGRVNAHSKFRNFFSYALLLFLSLFANVSPASCRPTADLIVSPADLLPTVHRTLVYLRCDSSSCSTRHQFINSK